MKTTRFWKWVYTFWPTVLRAYVVFFHHHRQDFLIGTLDLQQSPKALESYLAVQGFEPAIIALKDPGEILNMRKIDQTVFQYHLRLFDDGEIRVHHEYAPEARPIVHCFNFRAEFREDYFRKLLKGYLRS